MAAFGIVGVVLGIGNIWIGAKDCNWKASAFGGFILACAMHSIIFALVKP